MKVFAEKMSDKDYEKCYFCTSIGIYLYINRARPGPPCFTFIFLKTLVWHLDPICQDDHLLLFIQSMFNNICWRFGLRLRIGVGHGIYKPLYNVAPIGVGPLWRKYVTSYSVQKYQCRGSHLESCWLVTCSCSQNFKKRKLGWIRRYGVESISL